MYYKKSGKDHTVPTLQAATARGQSLGLDEIVLASTTGATAYQGSTVPDSGAPNT